MSPLRAFSTSMRLRSGFACLLLAGSWLSLTVLMWRSGGNLEGYLIQVFARSSRADAFVSVNSIAGLFWGLHSLLCLIAIVAIIRRRFDVVGVLFVGPSLAALFLGVAQDWSDPAWFTILAVESIGYMVGIPITLGWWGLESLWNRSLPPAFTGPRQIVAAGSVSSAQPGIGQ